MKFTIFYRHRALQNFVLVELAICDASQILKKKSFEKFAINGNEFPPTNVTKCCKNQYIFNTTCVSHTICDTSWTSKLKKNYYLYDFFASFSSFLERGFDNYLQHFVVMATGSSHLVLCFFTCAVLAFWEGPLLSAFLDFGTFGSKNYDILNSKIHDFWPSRNDQIESHRRPRSDPAEASKVSTAAVQPIHDPRAEHYTT